VQYCIFKLTLKFIEMWTLCFFLRAVTKFSTPIEFNITILLARWCCKFKLQTYGNEANESFRKYSILKAISWPSWWTCYAPFRVPAYWTQPGASFLPHINTVTAHACFRKRTSIAILHPRSQTTPSLVKFGVTRYVVSFILVKLFTKTWCIC
jgi:hypothetical protein